MKDILERVFGPGDFGTVPSSWLKDLPNPHKHVWVEMGMHGILFWECVSNQAICKATRTDPPEEV